MRKHTDLDRVREVAEILLDFDLIAVSRGGYGYTVDHPFFPYDYVYIKDNEILYRLPKDMTGLEAIILPENPDGLEKAKNIIREKIRGFNKIENFLGEITKEYWLDFLISIGKFLSTDDLSWAMRVVWPTYGTTIGLDPLAKAELVGLFAACNPQTLMRPGEYEVFQGIPKKLTVYRGFKSEQEQPDEIGIYALSWSQDVEVARWFAKRDLKSVGMPAYVYKAQIKKKDILAYFTGRELRIFENPSANPLMYQMIIGGYADDKLTPESVGLKVRQIAEQEIVVNPYKLYDVELVEAYEP